MAEDRNEKTNLREEVNLLRDQLMRLSERLEETEEAEEEREEAEEALEEAEEAMEEALEEAEKLELKRVGLFTLGLEVSRIPSWEVANEVTRALVEHLKDNSSLEAVFLVVGSTMQMSSLEFALSNRWTVAPDT